MKKLLIIAHDPSPNLGVLRQALIDGAQASGIEAVTVASLSPFDTCCDDVLAADAVILLTPENLGYMSGALKDFFDRCFHDLEGRTDAMPYALLIRAGHDGTGTRRAVESICSGLSWNRAQPVLLCKGPWQDIFEDQTRELGMTVAAGLEAGVI